VNAPSCAVPMLHRDQSEAPCLLARGHQEQDTDHVDEHGCTAPVLVHQSSIEEVRRWQDIPLPHEEKP
jgi:hypothetical protein